MSIQRSDLNYDHLEIAFSQMLDRMQNVIRKNGSGIYAGPHETFGIIAEEFDELLQAMRQNDRPEFREELFDIAVACLLGIASADQWTQTSFKHNSDGDNEHARSDLGKDSSASFDSTD